MTRDHSQLAAIARDPEQFRFAVDIERSGRAVRLGDVCDTWQAADFRSLDNGLRVVAGLPVDDSRPTYLRAWLERPRGHSKTTDIAVIACWAVTFIPRSIRAVAAAADRDQAALLADAIGRLVQLNPWLAEVLESSRFKIANKRTGSELAIISSDTASSWGLLPDLIVADEIVHWGSRDLFDSLLSSSAKRENCLLLAISNAGFTDSWQWELREAVRSDPAWYFSRLEGPQATWISGERLAEQRRLLPDPAYRRLWLNEWTSGGGDALGEDEIDRAFAGGFAFLPQAEREWRYAAGLDLSVSRDASALAIIGRNRQGRYRLAYLRTWLPTANRKIDFADVEAAIIDAHKRFGFAKLAADPFQAEAVIQSLQRAGIPCEAKPQTGNALVQQASALLESFNTFAIDLPAHSELERDLRRLRVEERSYGMRLVSPRDATGHGDTVSALSIALAVARKLAPAPAGSWGFPFGPRGDAYPEFESPGHRRPASQFPSGRRIARNW